jgi:hypothetical protein
MIQLVGNSEDKTLMSPNFEMTIKDTRRSGNVLDSAIQDTMGRVFNTDFSTVRVHTDAQVNFLARSLNAREFTTGQDIYLQNGEYNPGSSGGKELLAHEMAHVMQQNGLSIEIDKESKSSNFPKAAEESTVEKFASDHSGDILEKEVDSVAAVVGPQEKIPEPAEYDGIRSDSKARKDDVSTRCAAPRQRLTLNPRRSGPQVVQRNRMQVGDLDVNIVLRADHCSTRSRSPDGKRHR